MLADNTIGEDLGVSGAVFSGFAGVSATFFSGSFSDFAEVSFAEVVARTGVLSSLVVGRGMPGNQSVEIAVGVNRRDAVLREGRRSQRNKKRGEAKFAGHGNSSFLGWTGLSGQPGQHCDATETPLRGSITFCNRRAFVEVGPHLNSRQMDRALRPGAEINR